MFTYLAGFNINPAPPVSLVDVGYTTSSCSIVTTHPALVSPMKKSSARKSVKGQSNKFRCTRKIKNMQIHHKAASSLPDCNQRCNTKSSKEERQLIWEDFRKFSDNDERGRYLSQLIIISPPKKIVVSNENRKQNRDKSVKYFLKAECGVNESEKRLCKSCFMTLFRLTQRKIHTIIEKKCQNGQSPDIHYNRGKKKPAITISEDDKEQASLFLLSVPAYESHYGRSDSDMKYLPDFHTKSSLFLDFKHNFPNNRVHYHMFCEIFKELKLSIKSKAIDTCKTCDEMLVFLKAASCEEEREEIKRSQDKHWKKWQSAVNEKRADAQLATIDLTKKVIAYDLEQILPTPLLSTSVAFYLRQLSTFNLTIYDLTTKESLHNIWHEAMAHRGSNEINSCLLNFGLSLPTQIRHLIKYSDRCSGQNLNINSIVADLFLLQQSSSLEVIDSKFLVSGHTHMEVDTAHATIERFKKKYNGNVEIPDDWISLIEKASKKFEVKKMTSDNFFDFSVNLKQKLVYRKTNMKGEPWKFEEIFWIRVEKSNPYMFKYKSSFDSEEPFKEVSLARKSLKQKHSVLVAEKKYPNDNVNPIKKEKKDDLMSLMKYISPEKRNFYQDLVVCESET